MKQRRKENPAPCRYCVENACTNHFWKVMQEHGKPGLKDYTCELWKAKLASLQAYHEISVRAANFGVSPEKRRRMAERAMLDYQYKSSCPKFIPDRINPSKCRFFYLEVCLLTFPKCPGWCEDHLPQGDQH